uniref:NADH-ubiquinone oxidoreductase chain 5 n=1 Tax=Cirriformia cf. tentaculata HK-2018 TaxID=2100094 RepID=A0A343UWE9_9ANNE|nr:NADH dehydrogenase subunit 5 [Cirriformia cf. tentaculata HK-2018]AVI26177.1 NADH dehydrogenase subunit 5 [Cirriformia cf. tentaculata HK-2018]
MNKTLQLMPTTLFLLTVCLLMTFPKILCTKKTILLKWLYFPSPENAMSVPILVDTYSFMMITTVTFIAANIYMFSATYMSQDPFIYRFSMILLMFIFSMYLFTLTPHTIFFLLGWDGLGIVSFLLIIYYQSPTALAGGMFTALSNRIGDSFILLLIATSLNLNLWSFTAMSSTKELHAVYILIILAAITKSAQIPFSSWLPAAMAAPTPVSALVHSSTLVTAGVFLLIRLYPTYSQHPQMMTTLLLLGSATMLMSSVAASTETDLKKIIALSTLSQLGLMVSTLAMSLPNLAFFHLITHAFFKALLFIAAGTIIYNKSHTQDIRKLSSVYLSLPTTASCFTVATLALCGTPFLSGFYSKDTILEMLFFNPTNFCSIFMCVTATFFTTFYSFRLMYYLMFLPTTTMSLHSSTSMNKNFSYSMILMTLAATLAGSMLNWLVFFPSSHPTVSALEKYIPLGLIASALMTVFYLTSSATMPPLKPARTKLSASSMWYLTPLTTQNMLHYPMKFASYTSTVIEHGWLELTVSKNTMNPFYVIMQPLMSPQKTSVNTQLFLLLILLFFVLMM